MGLLRVSKKASDRPIKTDLTSIVTEVNRVLVPVLLEMLDAINRLADELNGLTISSGTSPPLNTYGNDGDLYVDKVGGRTLYVKKAGAWVVIL